MTVCNISGIIELNNTAVFLMTVGTIFISLAEIFENIRVRAIYYILGGVFIVIGPALKKFSWLENQIKIMDPNNLMLVSITVLFLSMYVNECKINRK
ncbi:hypothetical protein CBEIJ_51720 [Clostridium beijerinckii]|nr:hypothetical protein CBEIJ_51720 [Clostridium beijerinckii]